MFRNYIAAAFGNLSRNWLYTGVTILGLAVSFAAAILIGLYVRDEFSFDRFIPDHQRVYRMESTITVPGQKPAEGDSLQPNAGPNLALDFPGVQQTARMQVSDVGLRRGRTESTETLAWVDPGFFGVLRLPVLAGDPDAALQAPDGLVLTRRTARKYFGEDAPIGKTLKVSLASAPVQAGPQDAKTFAASQLMRVMAVLADPPSSSHMDVAVFGSGGAALSTIALDDRNPSRASFTVDTITYVKLKPGASVETIEAGLPAFAKRHYAPPDGASIFKFDLAPLSQLHFRAGDGGPGFRAPGDRKVDIGIGAVGLLIIGIAAINFVTLMTARATRRAVEVGIRKAVGARRSDLVLQFMAEALIYVLVSMLIGLSLAELLLPQMNAFVGRDIRFDYLTDPQLAGALVGAATLTALLAGGYPAAVMSGFAPALALKGGVGRAAGSERVRQTLVVVQFAILISLMVMTGTVYRQTAFALNQAFRLNTDQVLRIGAPCETALKQEIAAVQGVKDVACASSFAVDAAVAGIEVGTAGRPPVTMNIDPLDLGFFEIQGLKPLTGRFFDRSKGQDVLALNPDATAPGMPSVVLNETAARQLGFKTANQAVGRTIRWSRWALSPSGPPKPVAGGSQVIGVVRDFTLRSIRDRIDPALYYVDPSAPGFMVAKVGGREIPETLQGIDRVWRSTGHDRTLPKVFESQIVQNLYKDVITQGVAIAVCAGLAILIACLGLFAMAAFITERRTKEIGVRKAMGAGTADVIRLLLWQFTKPVLWANLIAWPAAFWVMDHWLHGFAYRVDLPPWLFVTAAVAAVLIAWATVAIHAWIAARAAPASALRYE